MEATTTTLIVASLGIGGTLTSGILAQWMARGSQREQWVRDNTIQEYRELLAAFTAAYMTLMRIQHTTDERDMVDPEFDPVPNSLELESNQVLRTRILIAHALEAENISVRWTEALENFRRTNDAIKFAHRFTSITNTIVWLATGVGRRPKAE